MLLNRRMGLVALVLAICGCGSVDDKEPTSTRSINICTPLVNSERKIVIVAMGDSLTEGYNVPVEESYPTQLEKKLQTDGHNVQVINAGISGETSSGARSRLDWVLTLKPDIVILETGGNDGLRGIDPKLTAQNIAYIVAGIQEKGVTVILAGMQIVQNMGQQYVDEFRAIYPSVAERHNVTLIPFFLEGVAGNRNLNQADGIHPTAEGYAIVAETVYPYVAQALNAQR